MYNSKVIRSLSLLLFFSLLLTGFGSVNVSAAENLVDSDLRSWENYYPSSSSVGFVSSYPGGPANVITTRPEPIADTNSSLKLGLFYSLPDLTAGNSYTFSFDLVSLEQAQNSLWPNMSASAMYAGYTSSSDAQLVIGLASYKPASDSFDFVENISIVINKDNYLEYYGYSHELTFELPNIINPCIVFSYTDVVSSSVTYKTYTIVANVSLTDNSKVSEDNFFSRLFEWFQEKFDAIGDSFTNLGDRIKTFFSDLGTSISNGLNSVKEGIQNKLEEVKTSLVELRESLLQGIQNLFVPDEDYILEWKDNLDNLLQDHLGMIYTSANLVTDLVQKIFDIVFNAPDTYGLTVPEVSFEILNGTQVNLIPETEISFDFMENKTFKTIYGLYTVGLYIAFGVLEVKYGIRVYKKVMAN